MPDLTPHGSSWTRISLAAKLAASAIAERARDLELQRRTEKRKALAARVSAKKGGLREAYKLLRDAPPGRLAFLRGPQGPTCNPQQVDQLARSEWGKVYKGNVGSKWEHAQQFFDRYEPFIHRSSTWHVDSISTEDVLWAFTKCANSAPGPDQWTQAELRFISKRMAQAMARLYNAIEAGLPWPDQVKLARSVFLAKTELPSLSVMDYRILTICSFVYRRWAAIRLHHLTPWAASWAMDEMFAGVDSVSAGKLHISLRYMSNGPG